MEEKQIRKRPKNIRQIGQPDLAKKVYIEDYVMTYAKKITGMAVLLGQITEEEGTLVVYISGAVEVKDAAYGYPVVLNNEDWSEIYADIKEYFPEEEIVGWLLVRSEAVQEIDESIRRIHKENFAGVNKILFLYEQEEGNEAFYICDNQSMLRRQNGYYIFYEKNEAMQNYMVEKSGNSVDEEVVIEDPMEKVREVIASKEPPKGEKKVMGLMYGASTVLAAVILVIGATMLNNYDKIKGMEETLSQISNNLTGQEKKVQQTESDNIVKVEKIAGNTQTGEIEMPGETPSSEADSQGEIEEPEEGQKNGEEPEELEPDKDTDKNSDTKPEEDTKGENGGKTPAGEDPADEDPADEKPIDETGAAAYKKYIVKKGDTLASICISAYNSMDNVKKIQKINDIDDTNMIYEGQVLLLP